MQNAITSIQFLEEPLRRPRFELVSQMATLAEAHDEGELREALAGWLRRRSRISASSTSWTRPRRDERSWCTTTCDSRSAPRLC